MAQLSFSAVYGTTDTSFRHVRHLIMRRLVIGQNADAQDSAQDSYDSTITFALCRAHLALTNGSFSLETVRYFSLYFAIIYFTRCQTSSAQYFKSKNYQITCSFCICRALQLPPGNEISNDCLHIPQIPALEPFFSLKSCAG